MESKNKMNNKQIKTTTNPHLKRKKKDQEDILSNPDLKGQKNFSNQDEMARMSHLKRPKNSSKDQEEMSKNIEDKDMLKRMEEDNRSDYEENTITTSKESIAKDLIKGWRKTPNMKLKFTHNINEVEKNEDNENQKSQNDIDENQENDDEMQEEEDDNRIQRHSYDIESLYKFSKILKKAENAIRESFSKSDPSLNEEAILNYAKIAHECVNKDSTPIEAIYFNEKRIFIAEEYNLIKPLINSLIDMGNCFYKDPVSNDKNISKYLMEKARDIFMNNLKGKDTDLEKFIYQTLINLYQELARDQEQMKCYNVAIELHNKKLEVLDRLMEISQNDNIALNKESKTESYLSIANLYYRMQDYDNTLKVLDIIPELKSGNDSKLTKQQVEGLYRYAQTFEMKGDREQAIAYLFKINSAKDGPSGADETILAKALLHLGRLYFKEKALNLSNNYLKKFYTKSKTANDNKDLLDIARVNLGMIKGTEGKDDYIESIKTNDYDKFLKTKLEYKSSQ